jgi:hypothetical protein
MGTLSPTGAALSCAPQGNVLQSLRSYIISNIPELFDPIFTCVPRPHSLSCARVAPRADWLTACCTSHHITIGPNC